MTSAFTILPCLIIDDHDWFGDAAALKLQVRYIRDHCAYRSQGVIREEPRQDGECEGEYLMTQVSFELCVSGVHCKGCRKGVGMQ